MRPNKSYVQADKCPGGAVLIKTMIEKSYLLVSFLAHSIYVFVPAEVVCDPDAQVFIYASTVSRGLSPTLITGRAIWFLFLVTNICLHFCALKQRKFLATQLNKALTSSWSSSMSRAQRTGRKSRISSASKISIPLDNCMLLTPLIYSRKRRGPKTDPWGTPDTTGREMEVALLTTTACVHWHR